MKLESVKLRSLALSPGVNQIEIPNVGLLLGISFRQSVQYDAGTGHSAVEDAHFKAIKAVSLYSAGEEVWFRCNDGRDLRAKCLYDLKGQFREDAIATTGSNVIDEMMARLHFGTRPDRIHDLIDPSRPTVGVVGVPLEDLDDVILEWQFGTIADFLSGGSGENLDSATLYVVLHRARPEKEKGESLRSLFPNLLVPVYKNQKIDISSAQSDLGQLSNLPQNCAVHKAYVTVLDGDDTRMVAPTDQDVTEIGIKTDFEVETPYRYNWPEHLAMNRARYGLTSDVDGISVVDFKDATPRGGLAWDRRGEKAEQTQLGFTTVDTGGDIRILYQAFKKHRN